MDASEIDTVRFSPVKLRKGYDMGEVDAFLAGAEREIARLRAVP